MNSSHRVGLLALVLVAVAVVSSEASAQSGLGFCRIGIAEGNFELLKAHQSTLATCLRFANYADCAAASGATTAVSTGFEDVVQSCWGLTRADGLSYEEVFPGAKLPFWFYNYTVYHGEDPANDYVNNQWGLNYKTRSDLDLPLDTPDSVFERKCISSAYATMTKAVRAGLIDQIECAREGGEPPWNCTIDATGDTRLARALSLMARKVSKCRDASGRSGSVSGASAELCNRAITTTDDLTACLRQIALCQVCTTATSTLDLGYDCAAISGDRDCDASIGPDFGKFPEGSFAVANEGDGTVTVVSADGSYAFGDRSASTFVTGSMPADVAIGERTNVIVSVNRDSDDVILLSGRDGSYVGGSQAVATVAVGDQPSAAAIQPRSDILYVANRGSDSVTLLDAWDGSYLFGTLAASTFPVGAGPTALAVAEDDTLLYVANGDDASVSFLDARTGLPAFGTLTLSTFPVGNRPSSLALYEISSGPRLAVSNGDDDSIVLLDALTGAPAGGTAQASSHDVAAGPVAIAALDWDGANFFVASAGLPAVSALREGPPWATNDGASQEAVTPLDHVPGDLVVASSRAYRNGAPNHLIVSSPTTDQVYQVPLLSPYALVGAADAERSMVPLSANPLLVTANDLTGGFYVAARDDETSYLGRAVLLVDASGQVRWKVQILHDSASIAYSAATDTVFVGSAYDVAYLDGSDGSYKFGSSEASRFHCGCSGTPRIVNDDAGLVYATCSAAVAFLDTADGSCRGLATPAISATARLDDIAYDRDAGILYVASNYDVGDDTRRIIVRHDAVTGQWYDGGFDESVVATITVSRTYHSPGLVRLALSADGRALYVLDSRTGDLRVVDTVSRAVTATTNLVSEEFGWGRPFGLLADPAGGSLLVFRGNIETAMTVRSPYSSGAAPTFDDVVYLDGDTLGLAAGDFASSRLLLGETDSGWGAVKRFTYSSAMNVVAAVAYEPNPGYWEAGVADIGPGLVLLNPSSPSFAREMDASEAGAPVLVGDQPRALAVMPSHTELEFLSR